MNLAGYLLVAFTPGLFWLWFFLRTNTYRPQPRRLIAITFVLGCLSTIPAGLVNSIFIDESVLDANVDFGNMAMAMLFVVGPVEEVCKFAVVRWKAYRSLYFDEPIDGLVYSSAASLGFASLENLFYVIEFGPEVMLVRAPISTLAHLVFGSVWGYGLGLHVQSGYKRTFLVSGAVGLAALVHAFFNISVFSFPLLALGIVVIGGIWAFGRFRWGQRVSPFRNKRNYPLLRCSSCQATIRVMSRYCRFCGVQVARTGENLICGFCRQENRHDASYCTQCGDYLLT